MAFRPTSPIGGYQHFCSPRKLSTQWVASACHRSIDCDGIGPIEPTTPGRLDARAGYVLLSPAARSTTGESFGGVDAPPWLVVPSCSNDNKLSARGFPKCRHRIATDIGRPPRIYGGVQLRSPPARGGGGSIYDVEGAPYVSGAIRKPPPASTGYVLLSPVAGPIPGSEPMAATPSVTSAGVQSPGARARRSVELPLDQLDLAEELEKRSGCPDVALLNQQQDGGGAPAAPDFTSLPVYNGTVALPGHGKEEEGPFVAPKKPTLTFGFVTAAERCELFLSTSHPQLAAVSDELLAARVRRSHQQLRQNPSRVDCVESSGRRGAWRRCRRPQMETSSAGEENQATTVDVMDVAGPGPQQGEEEQGVVVPLLAEVAAHTQRLLQDGRAGKTVPLLSSSDLPSGRVLSEDELPSLEAWGL